MGVYYNPKTYRVKVNPGQLYDLDLTNYPNYYTVTNADDGKIFCATSGTAGPDYFDFVVPATASKTYNDYTQQNHLYLYNPSSIPARLTIDTFYSPFDPLVRALGGVDISVNVETGTETIIGGFNAPLPAGTNSLGSVNIDQSSLTALKNSLFKVGQLPEKLYDLIRANKPPHFTVSALTQTDTDQTITAFTASTPKDFNLNFITNDGDKDVLISLRNAANTQTMVIKPGESVNNLTGSALSMSFGPKAPGELVSYRALGGIAE